MDSTLNTHGILSGALTATGTINGRMSASASLSGEITMPEQIVRAADGYGQGDGAENVTLTINDDGGLVINLYKPASASWTDFEYDEYGLHRSGILTIPQNSMFVVLIAMKDVMPTSDVITSEYVNVAAARGQGAYPYVCYVGTSDGIVSFA